MSAASFRLRRRFRKGLNFTCERCGKCCKGPSNNNVFLFIEDVYRLARGLGYNQNNELRDFALNFLKPSTYSYEWMEPSTQKKSKYSIPFLGIKSSEKTGHCIFLETDNRCSVYDFRPFQCTCFPFWQDITLKNKGYQEYSKECTGLKKLKGTYFSSPEILKWTQLEYEKERDYFLSLREKEFDITQLYPFLPRIKEF